MNKKLLGVTAVLMLFALPLAVAAPLDFKASDGVNKVMVKADGGKVWLSIDGGTLIAKYDETFENNYYGVNVYHGPYSGEFCTVRGCESVEGELTVTEYNGVVSVFDNNHPLSDELHFSIEGLAVA